MGLKFKTGLEKILKYGVTEDQMNSVGLKIHGAEWGRTFRVFFCVSRLSVHRDGLFVLLDLTNIIKLESGEKKKS